MRNMGFYIGKTEGIAFDFHGLKRFLQSGHTDSLKCYSANITLSSKKCTSLDLQIDDLPNLEN